MEVDAKLRERLTSLLQESRARKQERDDAKRREMEKELMPKIEKLCDKLEIYLRNDETSLNVPQDEVPLFFVQQLKEIGFSVFPRYDSKGPSYDISII